MSKVQRPRIVIAGTNSGAGKTTVTLGLMAALRRRGKCVQGFKVGPDYIDPSYHSAVTDRLSRNLDTWMMGSDIMQEVFVRGSEGADISIIEGVMGMYDGKDSLSDTGSTADIASVLGAPVILVVNVAAMARSAAAVVLGFQSLSATVHVAGVIVNHVGSEGHYQLVKAAIEQMCNVPVLGYLTNQPELTIPERHLGLIPALERGEMDELFYKLAAATEQTIDVDGLLQLATVAQPCVVPAPTLFKQADCVKPSVCTIAVARDSAFNFYYPENLELLEWYGANIVSFEPLSGQTVPKEVDGVYIGGGFPEEFAKRLSEQVAASASLRVAVDIGMPLFAECGGYMYLAQSVVDRDGETHAMTGILPASVATQSRLAALGYREITAERDSILLRKGERARGHEFHYSTLSINDETSWSYAYKATGLRGEQRDGYATDTLLAGYTHLHFASNPHMAKHFVDACVGFKQRRDGRNGKDQPAWSVTTR